MTSRHCRAVLTVTVLLLATACSADQRCSEEQAEPAADCADLIYKGRSYQEWRVIRPPPILQELGNATYPACNKADACVESAVGGFGATDVWLLEGVDPEQAVIGLREDTHTYVVFVEVDTDPDAVAKHIPQRRLG